VDDVVSCQTWVVDLPSRSQPATRANTLRNLLSCSWIKAPRNSSQPVSNSNANPAYALHSSDSGGQFWAEEAGIGGFKRHSSNGSQAQIDGCGCVLLLFEIDPVSQNDGAVECETRF
jgi:hypothetical protein